MKSPKTAPARKAMESKPLPGSGFEFELCWMLAEVTETARNGPTLVFLGY